MKLKYPLAALAAACVLAGCAQTREARQETTQLTAEDRIATTISTVQKQRDVQAAVDNLTAYQAEQRTEFVSSAQEQLTDMDQKLAALGETIASLQNNTFAEEQLSSLRELRSQLDSLLADMNENESDLESWYETKKAYDSVWADLTLAYQDVKATYEN